MGRLLKLLAAPGRLDVLIAVGVGAAAAADLARRTGLTPGSVGLHARALRRAGLVQPFHLGRRPRYRLTTRCHVEVRAGLVVLRVETPAADLELRLRSGPETPL